MAAASRRIDVTGIFRTKLNPAKPKRARAAIMFADIAGYSSMMHEDEGAAVEARNRYRAALMEAVSGGDGIIIQHYGDGSLCIFRDAALACQAARHLQRLLAWGQVVPVRVGLHLAEIVRDGEGVYGNGVNIAARVQSLCPPGNVLITDPVAEEVEARDISSDPMGTFKLRNIPDLMDVYALSGDGLPRVRSHQLKSATATRVAPPRPRTAGRTGASPLTRFIREVRRRKVHRTVFHYLVMAIGALSAALLGVDTAILHEAVLETIWYLALAGLPATMVLSWVFDLAPGWLQVTDRM